MPRVQLRIAAAASLIVLVAALTGAPAGANLTFTVENAGTSLSLIHI